MPHQGIISPPGRDFAVIYSHLTSLAAVPVSFFKSISIISGGGGLIFEASRTQVDVEAGRSPFPTEECSSPWGVENFTAKGIRLRAQGA
jgi:hypothetical protein